MWLSAAGMLALIYATLAPARVVVEWLRERNTLRLTVALVLLVVVVVLARNLLRRRPSRLEILVAVLFASIYVLVLVWMDRAEERLHLVEYGLVAAFIYRALGERESFGSRLRLSPAIGAVLLTSVFGWVDEAIQFFLPSRVYDLRDVAFNTLAGLLAVAAALSLSRVAESVAATKSVGSRDGPETQS